MPSPSTGDMAVSNGQGEKSLRDIADEVPSATSSSMAISHNQGEKRSRDLADEGDQDSHLDKDIDMSMLTISKLKICECPIDEDFQESLVP